MQTAPAAARDEGLAHLAAIYEVLSSTNDAILRATEACELYRSVCHAAVDGGKFLAAAVILPDPDTGRTKTVAAAGAPAGRIGGEPGLSFDGAAAEGKGLVGTAFRSGQPCLSNDFMNDERTRPWHADARKEGVAAAAAVPLFLEERTIGVLLFYSAVKNAFDQEIVRLIERMARNISFALANFERDNERRRAEEALRASEERYRSILESIPDAYYEVDLRGRHTFFNSAFPRLLGYSAEEIANTSNRDHQTPEMAREVGRAFKEIYRTGEPRRSQEWAYLHKDGSVIRVEGSVHLIRDASGQPSGFRGILRDVTARRGTEQALRDSEARFRALTNLSSDWYWEQDTGFRYTRMESRHSNTDAARAYFLGKRAWETALEIHAEGGWEAHRRMLLAREPYRDVIMYRQLPGGKPYYISVSAEPVFDATGCFTGYRGVSREITDQKLAEQRIRYLATHDALTRLPNRMMFSQLLNAAIASARRYGRSFAVLFIDLDRFKFVNDMLGHEAGDALLQEIASRFLQVLRASDTLARLGGDEFVVLVQEIDDRERATAVARKLLSAALKPVVLAGQECRVTASVGIAMFPEHGEDEQALMKNADIAMYFAKEEGKNNFQFYSKDIRSLSLERLTLEANLRHALERDEFSLHYQAKVDLKSGAITGVEALLRWENATLGVVPPSRFIPVAEESGLIVPIGKWVLRAACRQNVAWQSEGLPPVCVAVNLSVRQFADEHLLDDVADVLRETGMDPGLLELEITEGMVVHDPEQAIAVLTAIKQMGARLAIDDFGTGYSSLGQLKHFPIDTLKVDRSFIRDIVSNPEDKAITQAIIAMGKTLSLTVVAEGVETPEQEEFLRQHACDEMQGFYFSRPVPEKEFAELLRASGRKPVTAARS